MSPILIDTQKDPREFSSVDKNNGICKVWDLNPGHHQIKLIHKKDSVHFDRRKTTYCIIEKGLDRSWGHRF